MDIDYLLIILPAIVFLGISGLILVIWQYGNFRHKKELAAPPAVDEVDEKEIFQTAPHDSQTDDAEEPDPLFTEPLPKETLSEEPNTQALEALIILQLLATEERPYQGYELVQTLSSAGFHYGAMNIFHFYADPDEKKERLFSLASAVEPGTFDLDHIGEIHAPGLCLFMSLNTTHNALDTFEIMLETAQLLIQDLGGTLCDQQREPLTVNALTDYRSQLHAYA
jgi:cell division protein ZipA